jgi:hypothetical protein
MLPGLVGFSPGLVGFLLFTWPGGLLIELIALHPAWHWRRSALHATRPSLNTQTAAYYLYFYPRWRNFRRIWGRIFSRSGEIFSGFGAEFSADLAKISAGPGRFSSPLACVVAAYVVEFSPLLSVFFAAYVRVSPVSPVDWGPLVGWRRLNISAAPKINQRMTKTSAAGDVKATCDDNTDYCGLRTTNDVHWPVIKSARGTP